MRNGDGFTSCHWEHTGDRKDGNMYMGCCGQVPIGFRHHSISGMLNELRFLQEEVKGLERFRALRIKHNEEMAIRTTALAHAEIKLREWENVGDIFGALGPETVVQHCRQLILSREYLMREDENHLALIKAWLETLSDDRSDGNDIDDLKARSREVLGLPAVEEEA